MARWYRKAAKLFSGLLVLYVIHMTWPYIYYREPIHDVRDQAKIVQPLPEDRAGETLLRFSADVATTEMEIPFFAHIDADELSAYHEAHTDTLAAFWNWYDDGGRQALAPQSHAPNAARFYLYELDDPLLELSPATPRGIARLLLVQAYRDYAADRAEDGRRALTAAFEIGHFLLQNPDLLYAVFGYWILNDCQFVLAEMVPASELTEDWLVYLPNRALLTDVWRKVDWVSAAGGAAIFSDPIAANARAGELDYPWLYRLAGGYHAGHTLNMIHQAHQDFCRDIAGPIDDSDFAYNQNAGEFDIFSLNPVGRLLFAISVPMIKRFINRHALITARADVLRVRLALQAAGLPWQRDHVIAQFEALGLRDPFTGEAYRVLENGDVDVFRADDYRWERIPSAHFSFTGMVGPEPYLLSPGKQALWLKQRPLPPFATSLRFAPPPTPVAPGTFFDYQVLAEPNPRLRQCFLEAGPGVAAVDDSGRVQWQIDAADRGVVPIRISLVDHEGAVVYHDFVVEIR